MVAFIVPLSIANSAGACRLRDEKPLPLARAIFIRHHEMSTTLLYNDGANMQRLRRILILKSR